MTMLRHLNRVFWEADKTELRQVDAIISELLDKTRCINLSGYDNEKLSLSILPIPSEFHEALCIAKLSPTQELVKASFWTQALQGKLIVVEGGVIRKQLSWEFFNDYFAKVGQVVISQADLIALQEGDIDYMFPASFIAHCKEQGITHLDNLHDICVEFWQAARVYKKLRFGETVDMVTPQVEYQDGRMKMETFKQEIEIELLKIAEKVKRYKMTSIHRVLAERGEYSTLIGYLNRNIVTEFYLLRNKCPQKRECVSYMYSRFFEILKDQKKLEESEEARAVPFGTGLNVEETTQELEKLINSNLVCPVIMLTSTQMSEVTTEVHKNISSKVPYWAKQHLEKIRSRYPKMSSQRRDINILFWRLMLAHNRVAEIRKSANADVES